MMKATDVSTGSSPRWGLRILVAAASILFLTDHIMGSEEMHSMQKLELTLNGRPVALDPGPRLDNGVVTVPLHGFTGILGAEAKRLEAEGPLVVCKGDLCIPLDEETELTTAAEGTLFALLSAFIEPLGYRWEVRGSVLALSDVIEAEGGLGIGDRPPGFTLPDLYSGKPVSLGDHLGKKTVFYMWASW